MLPAQVRARLRPDLVTQHAEIFLINGDMNSNLYTSSRAMHSSILSLLQAEGSNMSRAGVGRLQNMTVSVQRRWNNVLSDATRQVPYSLLTHANPLQQCPGIACACPAHGPVVVPGQRQGLACQNFHASLQVKPSRKDDDIFSYYTCQMMSQNSSWGQVKGLLVTADGGGAFPGPQAEDLLPISPAAVHGQLPQG